MIAVRRRGVAAPALQTVLARQASDLLVIDESSLAAAARRARCQEPSWLENIELRTEKATKRENDRQRIFSRVMALCRRLNWSRVSARTPLTLYARLASRGREKRFLPRSRHKRRTNGHW
jgi:hypothetical protein